MTSYLPDAQQPLFGAELPVLTRRDSTEQPSPRKEIIERVYAAANKQFIDGYRAFLISYSGRVTDFIAGDVTAEYEATRRKLTKIEGKQLGGLYQSLQREGVIVKTGGYRARNQGNPSAVYRLNK